MRIAALYDIYGNAPALHAVLQEIAREQVNLIVIGGDVVVGAMAREMLTYLKIAKGRGKRAIAFANPWNASWNDLKVVTWSEIKDVI